MMWPNQQQQPSQPLSSNADLNNLILGLNMNFPQNVVVNPVTPYQQSGVFMPIGSTQIQSQQQQYPSYSTYPQTNNQNYQFQNQFQKEYMEQQQLIMQQQFNIKQKDEEIQRLQSIFQLFIQNKQQQPLPIPQSLLATIFASNQQPSYCYQQVWEQQQQAERLSQNQYPLNYTSNQQNVPIYNCQPSNGVQFISNQQNEVQTMSKVNPSTPTQNQQFLDCQLSAPSTAAAEDFQNSQLLNFIVPQQNQSYIGNDQCKESTVENIISPQLGTQQVLEQNMRTPQVSTKNLIQISSFEKQLNKKQELCKQESKELSSQDLTSLQRTSTSSISEDIENDNNSNNHNNLASNNSTASLNKRTRCLYEPLFRIISPTFPEKKSYKKNITKYLISYSLGKEKENEKSSIIVEFIEQNNPEQLGKYITSLLQFCKMAPQKKQDIQAHKYIAERLCKDFQRKQSKYTTN